LGASISIVPYSTFTNLDLGKLAPTKFITDLADRIIKHPKGIEENVLVGIDKFLFPIDFVVLDMPEDIKVPLILRRPFLSTAHAKIDVFKRKITLRVRDDKIVFKSDKPTSNIIKRIFALGLRERMELNLEARLMGEALILNGSLDHVYRDCIELNDLSKPLELWRNQVKELGPTIKECKVIYEPMKDIVITRNDDTEYPGLVYYTAYFPVEYDVSRSLIGYKYQGMLLDPFQFSHPKRKFTMEEIMNKFIKEGKREHEEMEAFIKEFKTTNKLLFKERNNSLSLGEPKPTRISLELADRFIQYSQGIAENILIKVDKLILPIDFVILDMQEDSRIPIILGRPFLATVREMIDVFNKITFRVGDDEEPIRRITQEDTAYQKAQEMQGPERAQRWRVCIDYRKLNDATRKDHFNLPFIDQMLARLSENEYYCFLDGFSEGCRLDYAMPPTTFQRCMTAIFHDMVEDFMEVFMDDFSVFGNSSNQYLKNLDKMLCRCEETNLVLNWEKCHFMVKEDAKLDFSEDGKKAFNKLKEKLTTAPIIISPDWSVPFELMCDASDFAVGAVLGKRIEGRWVLLLQGFNIKIKDKNEAKNLAADHLSRLENPNIGELAEEGITDEFHNNHLMI
nr:DNA-directed DNA polymerase [Tanacetum cinerariifolium]